MQFASAFADPNIALFCCTFLWAFEISSSRRPNNFNRLHHVRRLQSQYPVFWANCILFFDSHSYQNEEMHLIHCPKTSVNVVSERSTSALLQTTPNVVGMESIDSPFFNHHRVSEFSWMNERSSMTLMSYVLCGSKLLLRQQRCCIFWSYRHQWWPRHILSGQ